MRRMPLILGLGAFIMAGLAIIVVATPPGTPPDFLAPSDGTQEVPLRVTDATGQALFKIENEGTAISYRLIVQDISNVVASHIHLGPVGVNGPIVVFLYGNAPPGGGPIEGLIAEGTFTKSNLTGPLAGQELSVLIEALRTGGAYVNVHTNDGVAPTNQGPGDFPGGEIRAQVQRAHDHNPNTGAGPQLLIETEPPEAVTPPREEAVQN